MALRLSVQPESRTSICTWSVYVCACLIRKAQSIRLKLCLFLVIVFSVFLLLLLSTSAQDENTFEMTEFVLLNETESLLAVNLTGTCMYFYYVCIRTTQAQ